MGFGMFFIASKNEVPGAFTSAYTVRDKYETGLSPDVLHKTLSPRFAAIVSDSEKVRYGRVRQTNWVKVAVMKFRRAEER